MRTILARFRFAVAHLWRGFRQATGDAAYESYLRSKSRTNSSECAECGLLSRREFYLDSIRRKYSTIDRCC